MPLDPEHPLRITTNKWCEKIKLARKFKKEHFDVYAEEGMAFYTGFNSVDAWNEYMVGKDGKGVVSDEGETPDVQFKFMLARVAELVQIYGPMLYHRNPVRTITPRQVAEIPIEVFDMMVPPLPPPPQPPPMQPGMDPQMAQQMAQQQQQQYQQAQQQRQQQVQQAHQQAVEQQQKVNNVARARGALMETYLNYTPNELDLKRHSRRAIDEALIKGMGLLWTETHQPYEGAPTLVGSFFDSIDNLVVDPDSEEIENARWIARKCKRPVWQVADEYDLDEETLREKAQVTSIDKHADNMIDREFGESDDDDAHSNDLMEYWKVYSRMGMGDRLSGIPKEQRRVLDEFGDNVYLVIAKGIDYPLNLPEELLIAIAEARAENDRELYQELFDEAFERVQWPIPFWIENEWPFEELSFHYIPNQPYPMAHIRPGLPELKFSNWTMSFMADNARHTSRLLIGVKAALEDDDKYKLTNGSGCEAINLKGMDGDTIDKLISYISPPNGTAMDLWNVNEKVELNFDKRTGLDETFYAQPGGMRSATEAQLKGEARNIRPDDMANRVEDWQSRVARKEALAAQWLLDPEDVAGVLGPVGAQIWETLIMSADPGVMTLEFDYRIEAGSARKPNKAQKIENMQQALQTMLPVVQQYSAMSGDVGPMNALLLDWAKANDIDGPERYLLKPPDPQQQQMQQQMQERQMALEEQKAQAEIAKAQIELQGKQMDGQLKQLEFQFKEQEGQMAQQQQQQEMQQEQMQFEQEMQQDEREHDQEMAQAREKTQLELALEQMMGRQKMELAEQQNEQKIQQMKAQAKAKPKSNQGA